MAKEPQPCPDRVPPAPPPRKLPAGGDATRLMKLVRALGRPPTLSDGPYLPGKGPRKADQDACNGLYRADAPYRPDKFGAPLTYKGAHWQWAYFTLAEQMAFADGFLDYSGIEDGAVFAPVSAGSKPD